jgi:cobalamin biosynthesis protein CobD/CbiB
VTFLALVAALLIEQARALAPDNPAYAHYRRFIAFVERTLHADSYRQGVMAWIAALAPPVVVVACIAFWLHRWAPPLALLFDVAVLYLTMGFRQFGHRYRETHEALRAADLHRARRELERWYPHDFGELSGNEVSRLAIERGLVCAHRHVFGVIAWFAVFGAAGAVLYRVAAMLQSRWARDLPPPSQDASRNEFARFSAEAFEICDWVPVRLTAVSFAIVGDFEDALYCWRTQANAWPRRDEAVVLTAGAGAMGVRLGALAAAATTSAPAPEIGTGDDADPELMTSAIGLVWRALLLWLFVILLLTVAGWFGSAGA